jgi:hypothetical protein
MPQGEKFLHGNQSHAVVKIGAKSKLFGKKNEEPKEEKEQDPRIGKARHGWKIPVKNEITYRPLSAQKHAPAKPSPLSSAPITSDNVDETSAPSPLKVDYAKIAAMNRKTQGHAKGLQPTAQNRTMATSSSEQQFGAGPSIIMRIQPFPPRGTVSSPSTGHFVQAGPSSATPARHDNSTSRPHGGFSSGTTYTAPGPQHPGVAVIHPTLAVVSSSRAPVAAETAHDDEPYNPFASFDWNAVYTAGEYNLKPEFRLNHQLQVLRDAIEDYRVNGLPYGKPCPPSLRPHFPDAP